MSFQHTYGQSAAVIDGGGGGGPYSVYAAIYGNNPPPEKMLQFDEDGNWEVFGPSVAGSGSSKAGIQVGPDGDVWAAYGGTGPRRYSGEDGAELWRHAGSSPSSAGDRSLAVRKTGWSFASNSAGGTNAHIYGYDDDGVYQGSIPPYVSSANKYIEGLSVDRDGYVYSHTFFGNITKHDGVDDFEWSADTNVSEFHGGAIEVGPHDSLLARGPADRLIRVSLTGTPIKTVTIGTGQAHPNALAVNDADEPFVARTTDGMIEVVKIDADLNTELWVCPLDVAAGIAHAIEVTPNGYVYAATDSATSDYAMHQIAPDGTLRWSTAIPYQLGALAAAPGRVGAGFWD